MKDVNELRDGTTTPILGIDVSKPPALSLEPIRASAGTEYVRSEFRPKPWMTNQSLDRWLIVFAGLFILRAELGKADEAFPPVDELVKRVLVQEEADRQHQVGLEYSFNLTTEHYDANGQRTSAQTVRASAKAKANIEYAADVAPGARGTAKNDQEASQGVKQNQSLRAQLDLAKLAPRFVYAIQGAGKWEVATAGLWGTGRRQELLPARVKRKSLTHFEASSGLIKRPFPFSGARERLLNR